MLTNVKWQSAALLLVTLWLGGCATSPSPSPSLSTPASQSKPPAINLSGFSTEFRAGYSDGCASVNASRKRDDARARADTQYAQGWRDGYDGCRRRQ